MAIVSLEGTKLSFECPNCVSIGNENPVREIQLSDVSLYSSGPTLIAKLPPCPCDTTSHIVPSVNGLSSFSHLRRVIMMRLIGMGKGDGVNQDVVNNFSSSVQEAHGSSDLWSDYSDMEKKIYAKPQVS